MAEAFNKFIKLMHSDKYTVEQKKKLARQYYQKYYQQSPVKKEEDSEKTVAECLDVINDESLFTGKFTNID